MELIGDFPHNFNAGIIDEYKLGYDFYYYPGASLIGGKDGLNIQIKFKQSSPWVGVFAFGKISKNAFPLAASPLLI